MQGDSTFTFASKNESFRSSTVVGSLEELSTEKRNLGYGAISPQKKVLIRTIRDNERVLRRLS